MSATPEQIAERLTDIGEWKAIIEKHRRKTDDPSTTYVLKDGTRVHEDESVIAKLAASLSGALEDASTVATEAAATLRAQAERVRVLEGALRELAGWIDRALVPSYTARKPMPENLEAALAKAHAALKGEA